MSLFLIALAFLAVESIVFALVVKRLQATHRRGLEEAALARAGERALFDCADDALIVHSEAGDILEANRKALETFGAAGGREMPELKLADLSARPETIGPVLAEYGRLAASGEVQAFEWEVKGPGGAPNRVETVMRTVEWKGRKAILSTIRDLSKRGQVERERDLFQAQLFRMQKMDALSRLAGGFAHDFNNVLTGIMGSLSVLKMMFEKAEAPDRAEESRYLSMALDSCARAGDLTRQLLTLSRRDDKKLVEVDLKASLSRIVQICRNSFPKSIEIEYREPGGAPMPVLGDQAQLEQAILNVCINAFQAMTLMRGQGEAEGGSLRVGIGTVEPDVRAPGLLPELNLDERYAVVSIVDTGVGIDPESQKRLFEPFHTTKDKADGTGLGLSIVYSIMKQHSGSVEIRSSPGRGTSVNLYLPLMLRGGQAASGDGAAPPERGEGDVLVVDDEKAVRMSAEGMLKLCGYRVAAADSGQAGIDAYKARPGGYDLVLLDVSMPGKSGMDVLRELRDLDPGVKVVMMSGFVENDGMDQAIGKGAAAFLRKPFTMRNLAATVKKTIDS